MLKKFYTKIIMLILSIIIILIPLVLPFNITIKKQENTTVTSIGSANIQPAVSLTTNSKKIIGYYAAWSAYSSFTPDKLDINKLTHIHYAFAKINKYNRISLGYPDIDLANFSKLRALKKKKPSLKTLISIGGWTWSSRFSDVALTRDSRVKFADSIVSFITKHGFDGVDIDWEYPVSGGLSTNKRRSEDKRNFTLLLNTIREKLNARGAKDKKHYLLTIAGASGTWYLNNVQLGSIHQYLDYANIMTYDIHGPWDKYTDFNAPLYTNTTTTKQYQWSVSDSVNAWSKAGFPKKKMIIGIPFYGYIYQSVKSTNNGLYQTFTSGKSISFGTIASKYLNQNGYVRRFHKKSQVPWLYNGSTFISYDDPTSLTKKADYIKLNNLGGAAIWELSQDPKKVLLNALYNRLK
jgi:chitinase